MMNIEQIKALGEIVRSIVQTEKGNGWIRFSAGRTQLQVNYTGAKRRRLQLPLIEVRRNVPTADWRRRRNSESE